jgi:hypothetical protein
MHASGQQIMSLCIRDLPRAIIRSLTVQKTNTRQRGDEFDSRHTYKPQLMVLVNYTSIYVFPEDRSQWAAGDLAPHRISLPTSRRWSGVVRVHSRARTPAPPPQALDESPAMHDLLPCVKLQKHLQESPLQTSSAAEHSLHSHVLRRRLLFVTLTCRHLLPIPSQDMLIII